MRRSGFEFRISGFGFRVSGFGCRGSSCGFRVSGFGFQVSGSGFRVMGCGFRVSGFEFRVSGFEFRVAGVGVPRQSLRRGRQKPIPPQSSGSQKSKADPGTLFSAFTPLSTLAWCDFHRSVRASRKAAGTWRQAPLTEINAPHPPLVVSQLPCRVPHS